MENFKHVRWWFLEQRLESTAKWKQEHLDSLILMIYEKLDIYFCIEVEETFLRLREGTKQTQQLKLVFQPSPGSG